MIIRELGHVVLYVTDLEIVAGFYRDVLGFAEIDRQNGFAVFSSGRTHHEMLLIEVGGAPRRRGMEPGLYHIGFKVADSTEELREVYRELVAANVHIVGTADHTVTHSIYVLDPDGNELELYADVSDVWKKNPQAILAPPKPLDLT
ncbi:MAG: glyoxalase [Candidatus Yonathbacteria bacterium RIFOXYC1_FULL_52_10]|uniref:Glyoxalase n=1 Tax=Candidatus Yonathbacteria bacterium RIFOXYD1_FULL_52_36 TaxID=1802730 RepID=A0A1G2SMZ5_9BACT|nr:MAG: glyoxalase [Candidatus Yonathbacteria bacterium RIFOXYC1_FULL_52_10]OHA86377.1 MAG: glyoxalase [Candidatus Yonathbacteria bacterium RIFOXYD1_FULL_52_36]